jgi:hypothetical protein
VLKSAAGSPKLDMAESLDIFGATLNTTP